MAGSASGPEYGDLFNETLIESYVGAPRFIPRPWLAERIEAAWNKDDCRFVLLTAEPGAGKTAFMAWLAGKHPDWPRYFIRRDQRIPLQDADDHSFLLRIGYQLAAKRPQLFSQEQVRLVVEQRLGSVAESGEAVGAEVRRLLASPFHQKVIHIRQQVERTAGAVTGLKIDELVIEPRLLSLEDLQHMALFDPARALQATHPGARIVILVDALDEVRYHGVKGSLLEWLTHCPELPSNVRFVLTSRPPDGPIKLFEEKQSPFLQHLTIDAGSTTVQRELNVYARSLAGEPDVAGILEDTEAGADGFVEEAVAKAEGNIGYLDALARGVDQARASNDPEGLRKLLTVLELPAHIEGLYVFFIRQIKESVAEQGVRVQDPGTGRSYLLPVWDEVYRPILGVLSVAREPLLPDAIRRLGAIALDQGHVAGALDRLGQFLDRSDGRCRLYHATLPEFLTAEASRHDPKTRDLAIEPAPWHRRIADYYWDNDQPDWRKLEVALDGTYGLNNLASHLFEGQDDRLRALITEEWMAARFEGSGYTHDGFINDLMLAWQAAHDEAQRQIEAGRPPAALAECVRHALIRTSINSLAANFAPELVARAVETGLWRAERARSVARRVPNPMEQLELFSALLAAGGLGPEQSARAQEAALAVALAIEDRETRAQALAALAPQLTGEAQARAMERGLAAALAIDYEGDRARALAALAPQLSGEALEQGLAAALAIEGEWARVAALTALVPQLSGAALEQGLAAALAIEHDGWRADVLAGLAVQLTGVAKTQAVKAGLEAALAIEEEEIRADALAGLAPHLRGRMLERGLAAARAIEDEGIRADALVALVPQLTGELLEQGLDAALAIEEEPSLAEALAALAPQLTGEALARALEAALAIEDERARADALAALAPQLTGEALARALEAALAIKYEGARADALAALAPQLAGEALARASEAALAIEDEGARADALAALAPQLTGEALARELEAALAIEDEEVRARMLAALAPRLTGKARIQALARGLEVALAIEDDEARADALAALAPQLTGEAQTQALEARLAAALAIWYEPSLAEALAALAPQLTGEALARGLEAALAIEDEEARADALAALAPQLTGEALAAGLAAALTIDDEGDRVAALVALAPQLTGEAQIQVQEAGLAAALAIEDEEDRAWALVALAPRLRGEVLAKGLEAALAIGDEYYRAKALAALAPQLTGKAQTQALEAGLEAARAIWGKEDRADALVRLAPHLMGKAKIQALECGRAAALAIKYEGDRAKALAALAPQLTGKAKIQALECGLLAAQAQAIEDEGDRADALAALAPHLRGRALEAGLEAALAIEDEGDRAWALAALAPQLTGEALVRALEAALAIKDNTFRAEVLEALAPQLTGEARIEALERGLEAALAIADEEPRASALAAFFAVAPSLVALHGARQAIADHLLKNLSAAKREDLLWFCADQKLFSPPLLDQDTLSAIARHIVEVCQEWQWM